MNRRRFLVGSSVTVTAGVLSGSRLLAQAAGKAPAATPATSAPGGTFQVLRGDVGCFHGRGGTIGWLVNSSAVAMIDTQFPDSAEAFAAGLPGRAGRDFDVVVNTHHHGDHTGGNATLRGMTRRLVAHAHVPELLQARALQDKRTLDPKTIPDLTFADQWKMDLGSEVLSARYWGPAHTRGDVVVMAERANVVHMGDLMFNRLYPVIDRPGGASIRGWIGVLEKVAATYPSDAIYIFGHGNPKFGATGTRSDLLSLRDYLSGLLDYTRKQISAGKTKPEIVALENLPGFEPFHQPLPNRLGQNLGVAYDELITQAG